MRIDKVNTGRAATSSVMIKGLEAEFLRTHDVNFIDKTMDFRVVRGYSYDECKEVAMYIAVLQYTDPNCHAVCGDIQQCAELGQCIGENDVYVINDETGDIEIYSSITNAEAMDIIEQHRGGISAIAYADFQRLLRVEAIQ